MQMYKIKIAAQAFTDASGEAYATCSIPEPKSYAKWRSEIDELNKLPRGAAFGSDPDIKEATKYDGIDLKRGGQPIDIEVCEAQLKLMQCDKKNLLIFDVTKVEPPQPKSIDQGRSERR